MASINLDDLLSCPNLPTLPTVAVEVLALTADDNVSIPTLAECIQHDQALSARILKTVNSSYYGLSRPCPTITRALTYLGLNTVKSLVLGFSLVDITRYGPPGLDLISYWRRTLYAASAGRRIGIDFTRVDPDEAFMCGLMQDIGMLLLNSGASRQYEEVLAANGEDHLLLPEAEREALGMDHAYVGRALARKWKLAPELIDAIGHHHDAKAESHPDHVHIAVLASIAAMSLMYPQRAVTLERFLKHGKDWFDMTSQQGRRVLEAIEVDVSELSRHFKLDVGEPVNVGVLLARAEEASLEHQLRMGREQQELRELNEQLETQNLTDPLTGIGNRKRFDDELAERFAQARAFKGTLGVIVVDADRFKSLNDTYGHPAGDAVLVEIARRLAESLRGDDLVCRYGGEEFVVLLPGASRQQTAAVAERLRKAIEQAPMELPEGTGQGQSALAVTISAGAATLEPGIGPVITSAQMLVQIADKALYAAKAAGRNCVRVYNPQPQPGAAHRAAAE